MPRAVASPQSSASGRIFRFGAFEFDAQARELRKHGLRMKLGGQPISVLTMLLERPRRGGHARGSPDACLACGTYVDFEHSVNAAIKRLRQALGDSADSPRFVETLARNGYRFIAPVSQPVDEVAQPATQNEAASTSSIRRTKHSFSH
jgi:cholera toxin transcriptional activator